MNHYLDDGSYRANLLFERAVGIHRHKNSDYLTQPSLLDAYT